MILGSVGEYLFIGLLMLFGISAFHESVHLKLLVLLGGDGFITTELYLSHTIETVPPSNGTIVSAAGLIMALLFSILAYLAWRRNYTELYTGLLPIVFNQTFYGAYETIFWTLPDPQYMLYATPIAVISTLVGFGISVYLLYKALKAKLTTP